MNYDHVNDKILKSWFSKKYLPKEKIVLLERPCTKLMKDTLNLMTSSCNFKRFFATAFLIQLMLESCSSIFRLGPISASKLSR